jgi:ABC-type bacteriocin/lantibiotic exporter with double-glycine peptidase domain
MIYFKKIKKSLSLLEKKEKKKFRILFVLMIFAYVLETASIGSIIPLLTVLSDSSSNNSFKFFNSIDFLSNYEKVEKLKFFVIFFLSIFIIKNIYLIFFKWFQLKLTADLTINLGAKLYRKYLAQSYIFFTKYNSSTLIRNTMSETNKFATSIINSVPTLILESIVLITICFILFLYDPKNFLFITITSLGTFFIFSHFSKKKLIKWSKERAFFEAKVISKLQTGFSLSKIIKIFFKYKEFNELFRYNFKKYWGTHRNANILNKFPRHIFEILAVCSIAFLVLYLIKSDKEYSEIIILLGVFTAAAYRIFPAIANIVLNLQNIRFNLPSTDTLLTEFKRPEHNSLYREVSKKKLKFIKEILIKNITFRYPKSKKNTLNNLNLRIKKQKIIGITGASGSGKSTLIDLILGVLKPNSGTIKIDGKKLNNLLITSWVRSIGYVPQGVFLLEDTIENNIAFEFDNKNSNLNQVIQSAKQAQIHDFVMSLPKKYKTIITERGSNLSEGQKQRISIARALYNDPEILIFDEPTSSLDSQTEKKFIEILKSFKNKKTIILIAHKYEVLKFCESVYFFDLNKNFKKINKLVLNQIT